MIKVSKKCDTIAFYDTVDNLVEGVPELDFDELSTEMCDIYRLTKDGSDSLLYIDYEVESITVLRKTSKDEETILFFTSGDFTSEVSSNIAHITRAALSTR